MTTEQDTDRHAEADRLLREAFDIVRHAADDGRRGPRVAAAKSLRDRMRAYFDAYVPPPNQGGCPPVGALWIEDAELTAAARETANDG